MMSLNNTSMTPFEDFKIEYSSSVAYNQDSDKPIYKAQIQVSAGGKAHFGRKMSETFLSGCDLTARLMEESALPRGRQETSDYWSEVVDRLAKTLPVCKDQSTMQGDIGSFMLSCAKGLIGWEESSPNSNLPSTRLVVVPSHGTASTALANFKTDLVETYGEKEAARVFEQSEAFAREIKDNADKWQISRTTGNLHPGHRFSSQTSEREGHHMAYYLGYARDLNKIARQRDESSDYDNGGVWHEDVMKNEILGVAPAYLASSIIDDLDTAGGAQQSPS